MKYCLLVNLICFLLSFFGSRMMCITIICFLLNTSARRKRKKGMTFKEWFTFSRFRTEIPRCHIVIYYSVIAVHCVLFIVILLLNFLYRNFNYEPLCAVMLSVMAIWNIGYIIVMEGFHKRHAEIKHLRGIDKKAYREKMKKLRAQEKKEKRKKENADNKGKK